MKSLIGEFIGTFILVFFGCGSVGWSLFIGSLDLTEIATIWGVAVTLAIYCSAPLSKSHLNPAVSLGFLVLKRMKKRDLLPHLIGQFLGAFFAAFVLHLLFREYLDMNSIQSAMMFGEYYPNPGNSNLTELSTTTAFLVELSGTFLLMLGILQIVKIKGREILDSRGNPTTPSRQEIVVIFHLVCLVILWDGNMLLITMDWVGLLYTL